MKLWRSGAGPSPSWCAGHSSRLGSGPFRRRRDSSSQRAPTRGAPPVAAMGRSRRCSSAWRSRPLARSSSSSRSALLACRKSSRALHRRCPKPTLCQKRSWASPCAAPVSRATLAQRHCRSPRALRCRCLGVPCAAADVLGRPCARNDPGRPWRTAMHTTPNPQSCASAIDAQLARRAPVGNLENVLTYERGGGAANGGEQPAGPGWRMGRVARGPEGGANRVPLQERACQPRSRGGAHAGRAPDRRWKQAPARVLTPSLGFVAAPKLRDIVGRRRRKKCACVCDRGRRARLALRAGLRRSLSSVCLQRGGECAHLCT